MDIERFPIAIPEPPEIFLQRISIVPADESVTFPISWNCEAPLEGI